MHLWLSVVWIIFWIISTKEKYGGGGVYALEMNEWVNCELGIVNCAL